jgi:hypothetical protein
MSLTGHLRGPASPVRAWFADRLPNTTTIAKAANLGLRGAAEQPEDTAAIAIVHLRPPTRPPIPSRARSAPLAGTALDLLLRATLAPHALQHSAAANGAGRITTGAGIPPAIYIERDAVERIDDLRPWERELDDSDWRDLSALCLLLGRFEQASRSRAAVQVTIEQVADAPPTLAGYRAALVHDEDLDDVAAVAPLIAADHKR